eukprot:4494618-Amphidinium_carterae.1
MYLGDARLVINRHSNNSRPSAAKQSSVLNSAFQRFFWFPNTMAAPFWRVLSACNKQEPHPTDMQPRRGFMEGVFQT